MIKKSYRAVWLLGISIFILASCRRTEYVPRIENHRTEESLVGVNRLLVKKDQEKIKQYIRQNDLNMKETQTGLWFQIDEKGIGRKASAGMLATLGYQVGLLDGTVCYRSDSLGVKQFRIGKGGVESGLEEGILLLRAGDKAKFILPPHLAYGLPGDGNKIPARSIIVYDVEVLTLEP